MAAGSSTRVNVAPDPKLINLGAGDPDFNQPNIINKAVYQAMKEGHTHYEFTGVPEFKSAIAKYYGKYGVKIDPNTQLCIESLVAVRRSSAPSEPSSTQATRSYSSTPPTRATSPPSPTTARRWSAHP